MVNERRGAMLDSSCFAYYLNETIEYESIEIVRAQRIVM
jgi:hypothetical protein